MKVAELLKKLAALDKLADIAGLEVVFSGGVNPEYSEEITKNVNVQRIFDNDAPDGERRVVVLHGFDYGDGMSYEVIDARHHGD